ncbi:MAG TPA: hypothetical protein VF828_04310 [Patescibacteria group bacterium]
MTDLDRNTRTLIVAFSIAIFALVPLRFVEAGQMMSQSYNASQQVLGETTQGETVLPNAELNKDSEAVDIEAPYKTQTTKTTTINCISKDDAQKLMSQLQYRSAGGMTVEEIKQVNQTVSVIMKNTCK